MSLLVSRGQPQAPRMRTLSHHAREALYGYLCISPWIVGFLAFTIGPIVASFVISLFATDFLTHWNYVGFGNYSSMATDLLARKALINSAYYAFAVVPVNTSIALTIAVLLNQGIKGQG
ncbi:MAG: sugar ABC transporter permease [Chloroflexi bacterium]|nr:sugar ABC transporter permease [Chloroflexota bacterium]